jgi:hypothetical protein
MGFKNERVKVEVFLFPREFEMLKRLATRANESYSEYMRLAFICDAVLDGDKEAVKLTAERGLQKIWDKIRGRKVDVKLVEKGT